MHLKIKHCEAGLHSEKPPVYQMSFQNVVMRDMQFNMTLI